MLKIIQGLNLLNKAEQSHDCSALLIYTVFVSIYFVCAF